MRLPAVPSSTHGTRRRLLAVMLLSLSLIAPTFIVSSGTVAKADVLTSGCGDVFVLGARGSGQAQGGVTRSNSPDYDAGTGLGPQVYAATNSVIAKVINPRVVVRQAVQFPAFEVPKTLRPSSIENYFTGLTAGVSHVQGILAARATSCPQERIVLVGYSQGAMVMHRVVHWLTANNATNQLSRLAGVILIADGDRVPSDNYTRYGTAGEVFRGIGLSYPGISGSLTSKFSADLANRIHSVCNARDTICDWSGAYNAGQLVTGNRTHTGYVGTPPVTAAAAAVAQTILRWPIADPKQQTAQGQVGNPLSYQLTSNTGEGSGIRPQWRIAGSGSLPAGLSLSSAGLLTGTPTTAGTTTLPLEVRGSTGGLFSTWIGGASLTITVTGAASPPPPNPAPGNGLAINSVSLALAGTNPNQTLKPTIDITVQTALPAGHYLAVDLYLTCQSASTGAFANIGLNTPLGPGTYPGLPATSGTFTPDMALSVSEIFGSGASPVGNCWVYGASIRTVDQATLATISRTEYGRASIGTPSDVNPGAALWNTSVSVG